MPSHVRFTGLAEREGFEPPLPVRVNSLPWTYFHGFSAVPSEEVPNGSSAPVESHWVKQYARAVRFVVRGKLDIESSAFEPLSNSEFADGKR